jgi:hypothetical protein
VRLRVCSAGETVEIAFRKTTIHEFEITRIDLPEIDFRAVKGTTFDRLLMILVKP